MAKTRKKLAKTAEKKFSHFVSKNPPACFRWNTGVTLFNEDHRYSQSSLSPAAISVIAAAFLLFRRTLRDGLSLRILHRCGEQVVKCYLRPHGILHGPVVLIFPAFERLVVQIALALADNVLSGRLGNYPRPLLCLAK